MFVIRETFRYLRHAWAAWLLQVLVLGVALAVSGLFALLAWNEHEAIAALRANLAIEAFFDPDLASTDASAIVDSSIKTIPSIARVTFISKEQAIQDYAKMSGEDIQQVLGMNPLPASVQIYLADPTPRSAARVEKMLREIPRIQDIKSDAPLLATMESRSDALDRIAKLLGFLILITAFFQAFASARHGFHTRRETHRTLAQMGATRFMIVLPILFYNIFAGIFGGILGTGILLLISSQVLAATTDIFSSTLNPSNWTVMGCALTAVGFAISTLATVLNWRRIRA